MTGWLRPSRLPRSRRYDATRAASSRPSATASSRPHSGSVDAWVQPHLARRPIQSRVRFKPGRARFDVLLAPDAGLRYPNLDDHKKNVMYDVVRIQQALSPHAFVSSRPYAKGRWVVVPFRFRVGAREAGDR